jgi:hypothetical protein
MKPFVVREVAPGQALKDEELANFIRNRATTYFHSSGACRMGKDDKAVVDSQLRVNGVHNLRIADEHAGRHRRRPRRPRLLLGRRDLARPWHGRSGRHPGPVGFIIGGVVSEGGGLIGVADLARL